LDNVRDLEAFPDSISNLQSLRELIVLGCGKISLPEGITAMRGLKYLKVVWCDKILTLPPGLSEIEGLAAELVLATWAEIGLSVETFARVRDQCQPDSLGDLPLLNPPANLGRLFINSLFPSLPSP